MSNLPWSERVPMLSVNPDAASRDDIGRMAAELMAAKRLVGEMAVALEIAFEFYRENAPKAPITKTIERLIKEAEID